MIYYTESVNCYFKLTCRRWFSLLPRSFIPIPLLWSWNLQTSSQSVVLLFHPSVLHSFRCCMIVVLLCIDSECGWCLRFRFHITYKQYRYICKTCKLWCRLCRRCWKYFCLLTSSPNLCRFQFLYCLLYANFFPVHTFLVVCIFVIQDLLPLGARLIMWWGKTISLMSISYCIGMIPSSKYTAVLVVDVVTCKVLLSWIVLSFYMFSLNMSKLDNWIVSQREIYFGIVASVLLLYTVLGLLHHDDDITCSHCFHYHSTPFPKIT